MQPEDYARVWISPNFRASKLARPTLNDKIDVFEDQMHGYFLDPALFLLSPNYPAHAHAGGAALAITASYFETIAGFIAGQPSEGRSKVFFQMGFKLVFPNFLEIFETSDRVDDFSDLLYRELRCGLFHESGPRGKIVFSNEIPRSIGVEMDPHGDAATIVISPLLFVHQIAGHFQSYIKDLRSSTADDTVRAMFERVWDTRMRAGSPRPTKRSSIK